MQKIIQKWIASIWSVISLVVPFSNNFLPSSIACTYPENNLQKDAEDYTKATFDAYTNAKEALETAVEDETTTPSYYN